MTLGGWLELEPDLIEGAKEPLARDRMINKTSLAPKAATRNTGE